MNNDGTLYADLTLLYMGRMQTTFKGDLPGHPFRGNQYGEGQGGGGGDSGGDSGGTSEADSTMMSLSNKTSMSERQAAAKSEMDAAYSQGSKYHGKYSNLKQAMENDYSIADEVIDLSHNEMVAYDAGIRGSGKPEFVTAWRVGDVPKEGRSMNFTDQRLEPGLSVMAASNGMKTQDEFSKMFIMSKNRPVVYVSGFVHPFKRGSDGEPLLLQVKKLNP